MWCKGMCGVTDEGKSVVDKGWQGVHIEQWVDLERVGIDFIQQMQHPRFEITVDFEQLVLRPTFVVVV